MEQLQINHSTAHDGDLIVNVGMEEMIKVIRENAKYRDDEITETPCVGIVVFDNSPNEIMITLESGDSFYVIAKGND